MTKQTSDIIDIETDDNYAMACECGSVKFNLLKSGKYECVFCRKHSNNPAKIDIHILLSALDTAATGDPFDPDFIPIIDQIAAKWSADDFGKDEIQALYDCGPNLEGQPK